MRTKRGGHTSHPSRNRNRNRRNEKFFDVSRYINKGVAPEVQIVDVVQNTFSDFNLNALLTKTITGLGFSSPTPIQDKIIPNVLEGKDVIGLSNTGTGKTAAFLVPLIEKTIRGEHNQTLILAPTRELAIQIQEELNALTRYSNISGVVCVGGMNINGQIKALNRKSNFIIGTPGRILDLIGRGKIQPRFITAAVLDEADRMLDMGFIGDMRKILSGLPKERQTMLFSATMPENIKKLVADFLSNPVAISVATQDISNQIEQDVVRVTNENKFDVLLELLSREEFSRVLIFGAMKHSVERLNKQLRQNGISAESIHGNKSHPQRQRALKRFKDSEARVLVATDVAARGIHVENVSHVINYDAPKTQEDYVHRIGRTGRNKNRGKALTFVV